ncbi:MAG: hypothetical protein QF394_13515 [Rhodospirillales bacterium]|jgi:hypothetical protein|nr:hypothetical protein [Candidatus Latescibacterota bacterium]MDP7426420.1 hypothetical protein [Rhodospirillales bacterium]
MKLKLALLLSITMTMSVWAEESSEFAWHAFKDAIPAAQASDKMIMVDIYTDW